MALFIIADDSHRIGKMRGRGGYTDAVIPPRRKPVSIEDVDHIYTGSRKAARISDFANEDSEDLSRRSHLKDRKLLDDITTKLVNSAYHEPVRVSRTGARRPPVVTPVGRKPVSSSSVPRRVGIRPVPSLSRSYRASSLPPRYVEEEVITPYNFYEVAMPRKHHYYRPLPVTRSKPQYQPGPYIPAPAASSKPQYPNRAHRARSEPPLTRSSNLAVKNARRCLDRIERELGVDDGDLYYSAPPLAPAAAPTVAREVRARTAVRGGGGRAAGAVRRRPGSLPPPSSRSRVNQAEIERYLLSGNSVAPKNYDQYEPLPTEYIPTSFATLRSKTNEAKNKMDLHKTLMDRYLPIYFGPENEVGYEVDYKYGELVDRMPGLDPLRPKMGTGSNNYSGGNNYGGASAAYGGAVIAPYTPARVNKSASAPGGLPPKGSYRRTNSDSRNRIRYVVCYVKKNPYYY